MPLKGGLIYHLTCLLYTPYLGKLCDLKNHEFSLKLRISVIHCCVKNGYDRVIFVIPGMKVSSQYYLDALLSQQMLSAIKHVATDTFVFQQDTAPSHRAKDAIFGLLALGCYLYPGQRPRWG